MASDDKLRTITALRDLRPGMKNVTCVFIVIDKGKRSKRGYWLGVAMREVSALADSVVRGCGS